jgi:hypothetical protein
MKTLPHQALFGRNKDASGYREIGTLCIGELINGTATN